MGEKAQAYDAKTEYDAFGPWIYELNHINQLPPLFSSHYKETESPVLLIEIPRNIERRNAWQGMDLYDCIMGMYERHIYLLERKGSTVVQSTVYYTDIDMVEDYVDLLLGKLTLYTAGRKIEIPYNVVSQDIIVKAVRIIRGRYAAKTYETENKDISLIPGTEIRYTNLIHSMQAYGDCFGTSAYQPAVAAKTTDPRVWARLVNAIFRKKLLPSYHLSNARELLVISRGKRFKQPDAVYSYALTYIPREKIRGIELTADEEYLNLHKVNIQLDSHTQTYSLDPYNTPALDFYGDLQNLL